MNPWKLAAASILGLFLMVGLARSCGYGEPLVIPDWADSLASVRDAYTMDSVYWKERHEADSARAETYKGEADSWRRRSLASRPTRPPRVGTIPPDSGMDNNVDVMPDSASVITQLRGQNDSLWTALDLADSAFANLEQAFTAQKQATADAKAGWAAADSALLRERNTAEKAIADLTTRLRRAQRGSRLFGLIPLPSLYAGLGATLEGGRVRTGPTVGIGVRVAF